ncbi:MAG: peroxiredoxin-like family protein [Cyanobacteriota bacterium]|nr:peroxiredoxin-like family protein [Cyanobacteriota bacterium]
MGASPAMKAPTALLQRLSRFPRLRGNRLLVVVMTQLGDFDSLEYAQALVPALPELEAAGIQLQAFGIGDQRSGERFCSYTGFPVENLELERSAHLHRELSLYRGLEVPGGPWPALLLMCAGIGSPGTLKEVLRGYSGDRNAPERLAGPGLFSLLGQGYLRPFELATVRLNNMVEVLSHWSTYVPDDRFLTQRGATYLMEPDGTLLYCHQDQGILGFSETMARPLAFLDPFL